MTRVQLVVVTLAVVVLLLCGALYFGSTVAP